MTGYVPAQGPLGRDHDVVAADTEQPGGAAAGCELVVVLGGDGTILRGTELARGSGVPVLGVNLGHVGFLAEAESWEIDQVVAHVVGRGWTMEDRFTVDVVVRDQLPAGLTLAAAREKLPGAATSLDALCQRFGVDNSGRDLHGALLDSQLLAEVYLDV